MDALKILIMIPAYNEGSLIRRLIKEIKSLYPNYSILVVNDGSADNTRQQAEQSGAMVITLPYNLGIGGAVQTGYKFAEAHDFDISVQMDGDAQHDPAFLPHVLAPVISGKADLCIGSRFLGSNAGFQSTFLRRLGIRFFSILLGFLTGQRLTDPTSGFRATNRKLIKHFAREYPVDFPEPEAIQLAKRLKARITEVPVKMRKRLGGTSSIRYFSSAYYMFKVTLAILIDAMRKKS